MRRVTHQFIEAPLTFDAMASVAKEATRATLRENGVDVDLAERKVCACVHMYACVLMLCVCVFVYVYGVCGVCVVCA